jgi:hypothetical protein
MTFYGAMIATLIFVDIVWPQSVDRNLGLGMLLLTLGVPVWLLAATAGGILTSRKLRSKNCCTSKSELSTFTS